MSRSVTSTVLTAWRGLLPVALTNWKQFDDYFRVVLKFVKGSALGAELVASSDLVAVLVKFFMDHYMVHCYSTDAYSSATPNFRPLLETVVFLLMSHASHLSPSANAAVDNETFLERMSSQDGCEEFCVSVYLSRMLAEFRTQYIAVREGSGAAGMSLCYCGLLCLGRRVRAAIFPNIGRPF